MLLYWTFPAEFQYEELTVEVQIIIECDSKNPCQEGTSESKYFASLFEREPLIITSSSRQILGSFLFQGLGSQPLHELWIGSEPLLDILSSSLLYKFISFSGFLNESK